MNKPDNQTDIPSTSRFSQFFELLRVSPDPRVEKVLDRVLTYIPEKCKEPSLTIKKLLNWKQQFNILVVDSDAGGSPPAGRAIVVLDDHYHPVPDAEVRSSTGEGGTTDEHGRFFLHESWDRCVLEVIESDRKGSFIIDRSPQISENKDEQLLLYLLTDLDQYRPSQAIHVRGIAWRFAVGAVIPVKGAVAIISLVNAQSVEMVRQRRVSDDFGAFDLVIETDYMIKQGTYHLRFEFPEYKHIVEKPITIKNFTPPTLVVEAPAHVDSECGKDIEIPIVARYFYGDPVPAGRCTATVSNASETVAEIEFSTRADGTATVRLPTATLEPGDYNIQITGRDAAGRAATAGVRANMWKAAGHEAPASRRESVRRPSDPDTESPTWNFNASIDARNPGKCNISFIIKDPTPSWFTRPAFIFWTAGRRVIANDVLYPGHSALQPVAVPPNAAGLVTITILRVEQNGQRTTRGRLLFVLPKDRIVSIHVDGPDESRPGSQVSLGIRVDPPHDRKQLELGAMLVDQAVSGREVPLPFSQICQESKFDLSIRDSWTLLYSDLARELDRFLGDIIKHIDQYAFHGVFTASDVLYLVKFVERSGFCTGDFIEHHVTSLTCTCGNQPPSAVVSFILDYLRAEYNGIDELAMQLTWFPNVVEVWKYLIAPGNSLVQDLVSEFPGALEQILAWSTHEFRKLWRNSSTEDFNDFYKVLSKDDRETHDFATILEDVDRFLQRRYDVVESDVPGGHRPDIEEGRELTYYEELRRKDRLVRNRILPNKPLKQESIICVDQLSDNLLSDQATSDSARFTIPVVVGYPKYCSIMTDVGGGSPVPSPFGAGTGDRGPVVTVRTFFPDCGYWNPRAVVDAGRTTMVFKLPDTITQQDFVVQATSMDCDAGIATKSILVRQEFFIQPDIPPHLVYGDLVTVNAVVTNRTTQDMAVDVSLDAEGFAIMNAAPARLQVGSNAISRVSWTVHATACGEKHLVFTAASSKYKDVVDQVIFVHPEGESDVKIIRGSIAGDRVAPVRLVIDVAPGEMAHYAHLSIIPDRSSLALDGLEAMLQYPHGCVEQTMSSVLPNLLVFEALTARDRLTPRYKETCVDVTAKGLQRLLSFRHEDHGWGWWETDQTNLFMTAYVLRGLLKMKALGFFTPQDVIEHALELIFSKQKADGYWLPEQALKWDKTYGNDVMDLNKAGMTAWLLLCISETGDWRAIFASMVGKGVSYLGDALDTIKEDPYALAIAGLAIHRLSPGNPCMEKVREHLEYLQKEAHWSRGSALGGNVDATAKALHFLILQHAKDDGLDVQACVGWILGARAASGGWGTTMGTASVVEAVLAMDQEGDPAVDGEVVANGHPRRVHVDVSNITEEFVNLRDLNVTRFLVLGKNDIDIRLASSREVEYQLSEEIWLKDRLPGQGAFRIERGHSSMKARLGETITVSVKVTAAQGVGQCVVIEERIPAGFKLDVEAFEAGLKATPSMDHFTCSPEKIVLYPRSANCAFTYSLIASREFSGTHAGTEVYAMYNPDTRGLAPPVSLEVRKN